MRGLGKFNLDFRIPELIPRATKREKVLQVRWRNTMSFQNLEHQISFKFLASQRELIQLQTIQKTTGAGIIGRLCYDPDSSVRNFCTSILRFSPKPSQIEQQ